MVDEPVRVAIVGLGVMGRDHFKNALALQQEGVLRLVGLSDVEGERVRQAGAEHDIPVFETVEALLDETLLAELRAKAATGEIQKFQGNGDPERVLATLPEGT